jgi:hypothetical protein
LAIDPRRSLGPLEYSEGTRPVKAMNEAAEANPLKAHASAGMLTAEWRNPGDVEGHAIRNDRTGG